MTRFINDKVQISTNNSDDSDEEVSDKKQIKTRYYNISLYNC